MTTQTNNVNLASLDEKMSELLEYVDSHSNTQAMKNAHCQTTTKNNPPTPETF